MRVEQRIGRIDRNGQKSPKVNIYNMVTPGTVDADIYERCLMRVGVFKASVGDCEEILGEITRELNDIASDFEMSAEDRRRKLQQMTDNKVRFIKEQEELEEKQRDLIGIRVSKDAFDRELEEATNYWLSPDMIQNLIVEFLSEILGKESEYILGEKDDDTEEWAFNPGDYVITEQHVFNDGTIYPLVVDKLSCPEKRITKKNK